MITIRVRNDFWLHIYSIHSISKTNSSWCISNGIDPQWTYDNSIPCVLLSFKRDKDLTIFRLRYGEFEI